VHIQASTLVGSAKSSPSPTGSSAKSSPSPTGSSAKSSPSPTGSSAKSSSSQSLVITMTENLNPGIPVGTLLPGSTATVVFLIVKSRLPLVVEVDTARIGATGLALQMSLPFA